MSLLDSERNAAAGNLPRLLAESRRQAQHNLYSCNNSIGLNHLNTHPHKWTSACYTLTSYATVCGVTLWTLEHGWLGPDFADRRILLSQDVTGVVPLKSRPGSSWACDSPLTAEPLLKKDGSILGLHLTSRHLLIIQASSPSNSAAAVWLDSNSLEAVHTLALPAGVCHAWAESGLQKALITTCAGDMYTLPAHPKASCSLARMQFQCASYIPHVITFLIVLYCVTV